MKERLTGAIILVALIVLLVPELLTGPIRMKSAPGASAAPASPPVARAATAEAPLRSYTLTLGAPPPADGPREGPGGGEDTHESSAPQPAAAPEETAPKAQTPRPEPATSSEAGLQAAKAPTHPVVREARSPASSTGWVVQLGSFASRRNADHLAHALAGRGLHMSVSPARAGARVLWRVRAGPVPDRAGAEHLAARLRALGHRGELLPVR